jgi:LmbE family N-acetylglucosaminyl deacetylase
MAQWRVMSLLPISEGSIAAVVAHPDDESFGLGALLANLASEGRVVRVLCFTHGEASTLGPREVLGEVRRRELFAAAKVLGIAHATLLDHPDGALDSLPAEELYGEIDRWLSSDVAAFVVLEPQGVTGHPDHQAVSRAAERVADARGLPVVEWGIDPRRVLQLEAEHGVRFESIGDGPDVYDVRVDRVAQLAAIQSHASQRDDHPLVCKLVALNGEMERIRIHHPPASG